ncbi:hypothetical protein LPTSP3_g12200 [Leptospira kobayashii]|uniref:Uncharacterized protein n=1 Tax=Leptospira kobayashii TaxID=1917830 RepID=A0ABM7UI40_9LEPT|nr:hypothetical protein [Leptospira kobayashii]BDA78290.1 hypothetical protein LPTSP3_g12200 [Leptospira kobayashii]
MFAFVETPKKKRPKRPDSEPSIFQLFWIGLCLILGFLIAVLPFGAYLPVSISVWALVILFLPLLFMGIYLIKKYGYMILISVFLSLVGGGISILFLGDYIGYMTRITAVTDINPEEAVKYSQYKFIFLKNYKILKEEGGSFQAPLTVRSRGASKYYGPVIQFQFAPIRSSFAPEKDLSLYAVCMANLGSFCSFSDSGTGGNVLHESIWDSEKRNAKGNIPKEGSIFLVWKPWGEMEIRRKGIWSLGSVLVVLLIWAGFCFGKKIFQMKAQDII